MTDLVKHYRNENWTTSMIVAKELGRNHKHVMEKVRTLLTKMQEQDGITVNFSTVKYQKTNSDKSPEIFILESFVSDNGHTYQQYRMNKPAFSLLLMQMSGKKALKAQRLFNIAFYDMEQFILKLQNSKFKAAREQGKIARAEITDTIQIFVEYAVKQGSKHATTYYATITTATYKALGFLAQGEKVGKGSKFRDHLDHFQLAELFIAETLASQVIEIEMEKGTYYRDIYYIAKQKVIDFGEAQQRLRIKPKENKRLK